MQVALKVLEGIFNREFSLVETHALITLVDDEATAIVSVPRISAL